MSKPNLPPLPPEAESVYVSVDGLSTYREARDCYYTMDQMYAYAEEAVRQALAAQVPVAGENAAHVAGLETSINILSTLVDHQRLLLVEVESVCGRDGHGGPLEDGESDLIDRVRQHLAATICQRCGGTGEADSGGIHPWGAPALIPCECTVSASGHKPASVDTSCGHNSAIPSLTGCSPGDFTYNAEVVTVDEAKAYATGFARKALDAAAMKIGELGQKAFEQPGVPGEVHMAYHQALVILLTHKPETRDG